MRIQNKLVLALITASILMMTLMYYLLSLSLDRGMLEYVNTRETSKLQEFAQALGKTYEAYGSWEFIHAQAPQVRILLRISPSINPDSNTTIRSEQRIAPPPLTLLDHDRRFLAGNPQFSAKQPTIVIEANNRVIGYLLGPKHQILTEDFDINFISQIKGNALLLVSAVLLIALVIAIPLAAHFTGPIQKLAQASHRLSQGDFSIRLGLMRRDELGRLADDFNKMATMLEKNQQDRARWLTDISHELRTPLSILKGELEAMEDGIRPLSAEAIASLSDEVQHLQRLVGDIHLLSQADAGSLDFITRSITPGPFIQSIVEMHRSLAEKAGLNLRFIDHCPQTSIEADPNRFTQIIDNLLSNSIRYTQSPGDIVVSCEQLDHEHLLITVEDSAPGVSQEEMERIFAPLYRTDASRNRDSGGTGLGLAIAQRITHAMGGQLTASQSDLGGLRMCIRLPSVSPSKESHA